MKFNKLIPELSVADLRRSLSFYLGILEFKYEYGREEDGFAFLSYGGSQLMIEQMNDNWKTGELQYPFGRGVNFQFEVDDVSVLLERLRRSAYPLFEEVQDNWYRVGDEYTGNREFLVQDPDGFLLRFSQDLGMKKSL